MSNITWGWTSPTQARGNFEVKIDIQITEMDLSGLHEVIHHSLWSSPSRWPLPPRWTSISPRWCCLIWGWHCCKRWWWSQWGSKCKEVFPTGQVACLSASRIELSACFIVYTWLRAANTSVHSIFTFMPFELKKKHILCRCSSIFNITLRACFVA